MRVLCERVAPPQREHHATCLIEHDLGVVVGAPPAQAEGMTKIKLGPDGVTIEALQIKLSAQLLLQIQGLMNKVTGTAMNQISGGITMIG